MTLHQHAAPKSLARAVAIAVTGMVAATGCYTSHMRTSYVVAGDVQITQSPETDAAFAYEKGTVPFTNHVKGIGANSLYEYRFLEIPSVGDNNQPENLVTASYYRSLVPGSHPLVIVLPIWGTYTLSLIHISEPTRPTATSRMPSSA